MPGRREYFREGFPWGTPSVAFRGAANRIDPEARNATEGVPYKIPAVEDSRTGAMATLAWP